MVIPTNFELAPCPFCRSRATMNKGLSTVYYYFVKCWECGARTHFELTEEEAARRWNEE